MSLTKREFVTREDLSEAVSCLSQRESSFVTREDFVKSSLVTRDLSLCERQETASYFHPIKILSLFVRDERQPVTFTIVKSSLVTNSLFVRDTRQPVTFTIVKFSLVTNSLFVRDTRQPVTFTKHTDQGVFQMTVQSFIDTFTLPNYYRSFVDTVSIHNDYRVFLRPRALCKKTQKSALHMAD